MAKITRVARSEYKQLADVLRNGGYKKSSTLGRILIEAWAFEDGQINSDWWVREKVCAKGEFSKLRSRLIDENFFVFREDTKRYLPGARLKPYLQRFEETRNATLADLSKMGIRIDDLQNSKADRTEVRELREDIKDIRAQLQLLFAKLEACNAPPPDEKKQAEAREVTLQIKGLIEKSRSGERIN
jgi:hypothetical protein